MNTSLLYALARLECSHLDGKKRPLKKSVNVATMDSGRIRAVTGSENELEAGRSLPTLFFSPLQWHPKAMSVLTKRWGSRSNVGSFAIADPARLLIR